MSFLRTFVLFVYQVHFGQNIGVDKVPIVCFKSVSLVSNWANQAQVVPGKFQLLGIMHHFVVKMARALSFYDQRLLDLDQQ